MLVEEQLRTRVLQGLDPQYLEVINESHGHNVPEGSETHFKLIVVASVFDGMGRLERHRRVYGLVSGQLSGGVHALALHCYSPSEWQARSGEAPSSPPCQSRRH
ncbi:MAG: BolA/IbaG family iron-sulfur metabolism protein [Gammaproteobacteria bacterium]|nr:MAG: BolA/IbaG family iron-sulfur metabolism protein [Gammaproteobacteria bacterium]